MQYHISNTNRSQFRDKIFYIRGKLKIKNRNPLAEKTRRFLSGIEKKTYQLSVLSFFNEASSN